MIDKVQSEIDVGLCTEWPWW